ncbi:MAG: flagellar hook-length control protein FliK [Candidatus Margulisiibacteriota bacterium]
MGIGITPGGLGANSQGLNVPRVAPVGKPPETENAQRSAINVSSTSSAPAPASTQAVTQTAPATETKPAQPTKPQSEVVPMSRSDLVAHAMQLQVQTSATNLQILETMVQHNLAPSKENFDQVARVLKGNTGITDIEAAVVTVEKGLGSNNRSAESVSSFLTNMAKMTEQFQTTQTALSQLKSIIQNNQQLIGSGLVASISALAGSMDDEIQKLLKKSSDSEDQLNLQIFDRGKWVSDLEAMRGFMAGLEKNVDKAESNAVPASLKESLQSVQKQLTGLTNTLVSQLVLSKESPFVTFGKDTYMYWQIPNPFVAKPSNIDILIKRDPKKRKGVDPQKTKLAIKLETPDLGEVAIVVELSDQRVWYIFNTDNEETRQEITRMNVDLKERMKSLNLDLVGFKTAFKKLDIKKMLMPVVNLDSIVRIQAEV